MGRHATARTVIALERSKPLQVYRRRERVFDHGKGGRLFDADCRAISNLISGASPRSGCPPALAEAVRAGRELLHTSNLYFHPLQGELAARLSSLSGLPRSFFCNSGTEAMEACLKFARKFWHTQEASPRRTGFVALEHSFHGRTMGSLSVTWDDHYRAPFQPLIPDVQFVPANDPALLRPSLATSALSSSAQGEGECDRSASRCRSIAAACRDSGSRSSRRSA